MDRPLHRLIGSVHRLVVFDAVARTGSFTQAGRALGVSQPAVSRQIALLEDELQTQLFRRERNRIDLTETGEALHDHVDSAFVEIEAGLAELRGRADTLTLAVQPAIAESWFSPRLSELRAALDPTRIRLVMYDRDDELRILDHDVSIRFGDDFGSGVRSEALITESVGPMASPGLARRYELDESSPASALVDGPPLLGLEQEGRRWMDWVEWFRAAGIVWSPHPEEIIHRNYAMLIQQALGGRGVVLGWRTLLGDLVTQGMLTPVGPPVERAAMGYHLVWPPGLTRHDGLRRLRSWLRETLAGLDP